MADLEKLEKDIQEWGLSLDELQKEQFLQYYDLLIEWNRVMNLTAITEWDEVLKKHFVDSLSLIQAVPDLAEKDYKLLDLGTGAGFPGIPLKIVFPNLHIVLLDSLHKRIRFLKEVIDRLQLKDIEVFHGRAEDFARNDLYREKFDLCVSRAVANLTTLSEYCIPFVKTGGSFIAYKSEKINEEYEASKKAVKKLGGRYEGQKEFYLPDSSVYRNLFMIGKISPTPAAYPRKAGMPAKEPIS